MNFSVTADVKVKLKESKKRNSYLYLAKELIRSCNMNVILIRIVFGELETIPKGLVRVLEDKEIRRHVETIQTKSLLIKARGGGVMVIVIENGHGDTM